MFENQLVAEELTNIHFNHLFTGDVRHLDVMQPRAELVTDGTIMRDSCRGRGAGAIAGNKGCFGGCFRTAFLSPVAKSRAQHFKKSYEREV